MKYGEQTKRFDRSTGIGQGTTDCIGSGFGDGISTGMGDGCRRDTTGFAGKGSTDCIERESI